MEDSSISTFIYTTLLDDNQADSWRSGLITLQNRSRSCVENAKTILTLSESWQGRIRFNEFTSQPEFDGLPWDDLTTALARAWFDRHQITMSPDHIESGMQLV